MRLALIFVATAVFGQTQIDWNTQIKNKPTVESSDYVWYRTNGIGASGNLTASGSGKVITLTPGPAGVTTATPVWIAEGTGTAEAVTPSATTCSAAAATTRCTITVTTANTHTGAWKASTATGGIMEARAANSGATVISLPKGATLSTHSRVLLTGGPLVIQGNGATIQADLGVTPVIQAGTTSVLADRIWLRDLTIERAAGTIPAGSIGVLWQWYSYCGHDNVRITRHAIGEKLANFENPGQGSLGFTSSNSQIDLSTEAYLVGENAIGVYWTGGHFGINAGGTDDAPTYGMIVSGLADTWVFSGVEMIPRGTPIPTALISFQAYTGTNGVFTFDHCNIERWNGLVHSDADTPLVNELQISDSRMALGDVNWFALNAATHLINFQLNDSKIFGKLNLTNPEWSRIKGNFITFAAATITGGADASLVFADNTVVVGYTFTGAWQALSLTGNTWINSAPTITATGAVNGSLQISDNTGNTGPQIANTLGATSFMGGSTLFSVAHALLAGYAPSNGTVILCPDCQASDTIVPGSSCVSGGAGALAVRLNGAWKCY